MIAKRENISEYILEYLEPKLIIFKSVKLFLFDLNIKNNFLILFINYIDFSDPMLKLFHINIPFSYN